nr:hypothetical protein I308_05020 [Cryptococcus tetragattii IND107]
MTSLSSLTMSFSLPTVTMPTPSLRPSRSTPRAPETLTSSVNTFPATFLLFPRTPLSPPLSSTRTLTKVTPSSPLVRLPTRMSTSSANLSSKTLCPSLTRLLLKTLALMPSRVFPSPIFLLTLTRVLPVRSLSRSSSLLPKSSRALSTLFTLMLSSLLTTASLSTSPVTLGPPL